MASRVDRSVIAAFPSSECGMEDLAMRRVASGHFESDLPAQNGNELDVNDEGLIVELRCMWLGADASPERRVARHRHVQ